MVKHDYKPCQLEQTYEGRYYHFEAKDCKDYKAKKVQDMQRTIPAKIDNAESMWDGLLYSLGEQSEIEAAKERLRRNKEKDQEPW
jgi:hypothetical protein